MGVIYETIKRPEYNKDGTEKNLRCGLGGFAVKRRGSCAEHVFARLPG